jgi:hypothetical protein
MSSSQRPPSARRETGTRPPLRLIAAENDRREKMLMLEGACRHQGEVVIWREVHDGLTDHTVEYGTCMKCKAKLCITTWYSQRGDKQECYDVRLMTPTEIDLLCPSN